MNVTTRSKFYKGCSLHPSAKIIKVKNHSGNFCEKCYYEKREKRKQDFIKKSINVHQNKYSYEKVFYERNDIKICIFCPKHGDFWQLPGNHIRGQGCDKCLNETLSHTTETVIEKFKKIHHDTYDYSIVNYINCREKVLIKCKKHNHEFWQSPSKHLNGQGCPRCRKSHGERIIENFFTEKKIFFEPQKEFEDCYAPDTSKKLKFDFFVPDYNLIIEYDGEQHFEPRFTIKKEIGEKNYKRVVFLDSIKNEYLKKKKISLIRVSYRDKKNIIKKIEKFISQKILNG
jgi:hypothetical protein